MKHNLYAIKQSESFRFFLLNKQVLNNNKKPLISYNFPLKLKKCVTLKSKKNYVHLLLNNFEILIYLFSSFQELSLVLISS